MASWRRAPQESSNWTENICTRPTAVDWDADGDLDLVVGNFPGTFYLFEGKGQGVFLPDAKPIMSGESPLKVDGYHSDPFVVDWDEDGDLDLLSGSGAGGVYWAENVAETGKPPELKPFQTVIEPSRNIKHFQLLSENDLTGPTSATRIWVDDVNSDGKLDILVGDNVTLVSPANGLSEAEFKEKQADWQEAIDKATAAMNSSDEKEQSEARKELSQLYRQRSQFMTEDRTGFVWLYLRK